MKPLVLSKNSWHYKLVTRMTTYGRYDTDGNICEYVKCLLGSMLIILIISILFTIVAIPFVHMIMGIGFSIWMGTWFFTDIGAAGVAITCVIAAGVSVHKILTNIDRWRYNRHRERFYGEPKPDGFLKSAYKSWKGKYCLKIEFTEDKHNDNIRAGQ